MANMSATGLATQNQVLRNTYNLLAVSLLPTIIGAFIGMQIPIESYMAHSIAYPILSILAASLFIFLTMLNKDNFLGVIFILIFTGIMGFTLAPLLEFTLHLRQGMQIVCEAAVLTSVVMFASSAYITITKKDFSFLGNMLFVALLVVCGLGLIGMFFHSTLFQLVLAGATVLIFTGYLLYDVSAVVNGGERNYIVAALNIYLDLFNIFVSLIRILSILQDDD